MMRWTSCRLEERWKSTVAASGTELTASSRLVPNMWMWRPGSFWNLLGFLLLAFTDASRPLARLRAGVSKAYPIPSRSMGRMHGHRSIRLSPSPFQRSIAVACKEEGDPVPQESIPPSKSPSKRLSEIESTPDGIASGLTRRFGLAGGLAWLGFLTFGVVSEQVKTRTEVKAINEGAVLVDAPEVTTPSGLRFRDLKLGGGDKGWVLRDIIVGMLWVYKVDGELLQLMRARSRDQT
eukprot:880559-Amorphochlora_amoeboformis.AAC.2